MCCRSQNRVVLTLLIGLLSFISTAYTQNVCPSIEKAARHYVLEVANANFTLPNSKRFQGLAYNGSYVGPTITATLGEEISIDMVNRASVGEPERDTPGCHRP